MEVQSPESAIKILKNKHKLRNLENWSFLGIIQMRSKMMGSFERRMNGFYWKNNNFMVLKKYPDCILFVDQKIRIPTHKFASSQIRVGNQVFQVDQPTSPALPQQPASAPQPVAAQSSTASDSSPKSTAEQKKKSPNLKVMSRR
jgi:hypothetical protein